MPRLLVERPTFRIVEGEVGGGLEYLLEKRDGCDGLGVERWTTFHLGASPVIKELWKYTLEIALMLEEKK
jgi:hypothetical protein